MKNALLVFFSLLCYCMHAQTPQAPQDLTQTDLEYFSDVNTDIALLYAILKDHVDSPGQYNPAFVINNEILETITNEDFIPNEKINFYLRKYFTEPADRPINEEAVLSII